MSISESNIETLTRDNWDSRRVPKRAVPAVNVISRIELPLGPRGQAVDKAFAEPGEVDRKRSYTVQSSELSESDLGIATAGTSPEQQLLRMA